MQNRDILPYIRFLTSIQKPDLQGVWLDGKDCAKSNLSLDENPFPKDSKEYLYWNEGWWAGLYDEDKIVSRQNNVVSTLKAMFAKKPANDSIFSDKSPIAAWFNNVSFIFGTFMSGFLCYELVDAAI